jgi:hypothetical protein
MTAQSKQIMACKSFPNFHTVVPPTEAFSLKEAATSCSYMFLIRTPSHGFNIANLAYQYLVFIARFYNPDLCRAVLAGGNEVSAVGSPRNVIAAGKSPQEMPSCNVPDFERIQSSRSQLCAVWTPRDSADRLA